MVVVADTDASSAWDRGKIMRSADAGRPRRGMRPAARGARARAGSTHATLPRRAARGRGLATRCRAARAPARAIFPSGRVKAEFGLYLGRTGVGRARMCISKLRTESVLSAAGPPSRDLVQKHNLIPGCQSAVQKARAKCALRL